MKVHWFGFLKAFAESCSKSTSFERFCDAEILPLQKSNEWSLRWKRKKNCFKNMKCRTLSTLDRELLGDNWTNQPSDWSTKHSFFLLDEPGWQFRSVSRSGSKWSLFVYLFLHLVFSFFFFWFIACVNQQEICEQRKKLKRKKLVWIDYRTTWSSLYR